MQMGKGLGADFPPGYPLPVDPDFCDPGLDIMGAWWDIQWAEITIGPCEVGTRTQDWSTLKTTY